MTRATSSWSQLAFEGAEFWVEADPTSSPAALMGRSVRLIVSVDDPAAAFNKAVAAGAQPVADVHEEHGWLTGRIADPAGHHWELSRRVSGLKTRARLPPRWRTDLISRADLTEISGPQADQAEVLAIVGAARRARSLAALRSSSDTLAVDRTITE